MSVKTSKRKGVLIVLEGLDGSGKATQAKLLVRRLRRAGFKTVLVDFPRYGTFFGQVIASYLRGEFGASQDVHPMLASIPYALDRWQASPAIRRALESGRIVIANRYTTANMVHQASKVADVKARAAFLRWLHDFEYRHLAIPKPDLVLHLDVPYRVGRQLVAHKGKRRYLGARRRDIHERDHGHLEAAERQLRLLARSKEWRTIQCTARGIMLSREIIADRIWGVLEPFLGVRARLWKTRRH